jgi:methoxymalonate biosynthesis acyl carrier protein
MSDVKTKIRGFLGRICDVKALGDSDDIFERGFVNSLYALQLVGFVEKEFEVPVEDGDLELDNFRSVEAMVSFVERKRAGGGGRIDG